jgi:hypothetical protein
MAGFDEALERLITDAGFRAALEQDPQAALADYDLTDDERDLLTSQLIEGAGASGGVEQRTSKSGLAGALGMFDDAAGAAATGDTIPQEHVSLNFSEVEPTGDTSGSMTTDGDPPEEASNFYLKLDGIDGESTDGKASGGGSGTGKANVQDLSLTKIADRSSIHLSEADDSLTAGEDAGDPDHPVVAGSVYNAEDDPAEIQDGQSNTVLVSETADASAGAGTGVQADWRVEEGGKADDGDYGYMHDDVPSGAPTPEVDALADQGESEESDMGSPYLKKALFDNTMDPEDEPEVLSAGHDSAAPTKGSTVETGWDIQRNEEV